LAQRDERDDTAKAKITGKMTKMRKRRYIVPGLVESLTPVFAVKKVDDIRLVYNAAESGLNDAMVVPRFSMPMIHSHLRAVEEGTHMADLDEDSGRFCELRGQCETNGADEESMLFSSKKSWVNAELFGYSRRIKKTQR
jgi:hypothetical protein